MRLVELMVDPKVASTVDQMVGGSVENLVGLMAVARVDCWVVVMVGLMVDRLVVQLE